MKLLIQIIKQILCIGLFIILLQSCTKKGNLSDIINATHVDMNDESSLRFSDYFQQLRFIPLESNEQSYFKNLSDLRFTGNKFYVFSAAPDNMVGIYDNAGKHLHSLRNSGRGPGEINYATSFDVNVIDTCIWILDRGNMKIVKYNSTGRYLSELSTAGQYYNSLSCFDDSILILHDFTTPQMLKRWNVKSIPKAKLSIWDIKNHKLEQLAYAKDINAAKEIPVLLQKYFFKKDNDIFYWDVYNDSLMAFNTAKYNSRLHKKFNFGDYTIPNHLFSLNPLSAGELKKVVRRGYASLFNYFNCNDGYEVYIFSRFSKLGYSICIEKEQTEKIIAYSNIMLDNIHPSLKTNLDHFKLFLIHYDSHSSVYFSWGASDFVKTFQTLKMKLSLEEWNAILDKNISLKYAIENVTSDDNPIIMSAILRKNTDNEKLNK